MVVLFACYVATEIGTDAPANVKKLYDTPKDLVEALRGPEAAWWKLAYLSERDQLKNLGVYEVVDCPDETKFHVLKSKLLFKVKYLADGTL